MNHPFAPRMRLAGVAAVLWLLASCDAPASPSLANPTESAPGLLKAVVGTPKTQKTLPRRPIEAWVLPATLATATPLMGGVSVTCTITGTGTVYYDAEDGNRYHFPLTCVNQRNVAEDGGGGA